MAAGQAHPSAEGPGKQHSRHEGHDRADSDGGTMAQEEVESDVAQGAEHQTAEAAEDQRHLRLRVIAIAPNDPVVISSCELVLIPIRLIAFPVSA